MNIIEKIRNFDILLINYILDFTDYGIKLIYDISSNQYDIRLNVVSPKFFPIIDLFSNRVLFFHNKTPFILLGTPLVYYSTEIIIRPKKSYFEIIRLYYVSIFREPQL